MKYLKYFENNTLDINGLKLSRLDDYIQNLCDDNITHIRCFNNNLKSIPYLPNKLEILSAGNNKLTKLPKLPDTLEKLYIPNNNLTKLPKLPKNIELLSCGNNQLAELPELPVSLHTLYCGDNQLTELPELPVSLHDLYCGDNQLAELPELPDTLQKLYCYNNKLTYLPELPESVDDLDIGGNDWSSPIPYNLIEKYNLLDLLKDKLYTEEQKEYFGSYEYQKEYLTNTPEKYKDLDIPIGYNEQIKEEFDWLFNAIDMGLL